jgi:hypothetical protein
MQGILIPIIQGNWCSVPVHYNIFCQGSSTSCQVNYEHHSNSHNTWNCINMWNQNTASIPISFKISPLVQKKSASKANGTGQGFCLSDIAIYMWIRMMGYGICLIRYCMVGSWHVCFLCLLHWNKGDETFLQNHSLNVKGNFIIDHFMFQRSSSCSLSTKPFLKHNHFPKRK